MSQFKAKFLSKFKVYFYFICIFMGWAFVQDVQNGLFTPTSATILNKSLDWMDYGFVLVALVGLFGYVFNKEIGKKKFWKVFYYVALVETIVYNIYNLYTLISNESVGKGIPLWAGFLIYTFTVVFAVTLVTPLFIGLFRYSHTKKASLS